MLGSFPFFLFFRRAAMNFDQSQGESAA